MVHRNMSTSSYRRGDNSEADRYLSPQSPKKERQSLWLVTTRKEYGNAVVTSSSIFRLRESKPTSEEVKQLTENEGTILFMQELSE